MKKLDLNILIVIFLFTASVSFSQVNSYFLNNPVWKLSSGCALPNISCLENKTYNYYLNGDTVINSVVYKKVQEKGLVSYQSKYVGSSQYCPPSYQYTSSFNRYFLRSSGKQMFVRTNSDTSERLLYDFNLQVGDTLPMLYNNWETDITITSIDSIFTPLGYRKRFALGNSSKEYLYEGIGHSGGLFEPIGPIFDCGYTLDCFSLNDTAYVPSFGASCNIAVGITSYKRTPSPSIFPNPFNTSTTISFNSVLSHAHLNLYNFIGQKIKTLDKISGESVILERGSLNSGVYYFELIQDSQKISAGKVIITD